jgi:hypothetical protein
MKNAKSVWYKIAYYRSLLILIPANIIAAVLCIINLTKDIDDYPRIEGEIEKAYLEWNKAPFIIKLEQRPKQWYKVYPSKYYPILQEKATPGRKAIIWYNLDDNRIEQLIVEGELLRPYHKSIGLWLILFTISLLITFFNVVYIIRNPSHAKGEKGEIKNNA